MPRHPPIALKTLDCSHCQCPSEDGTGNKKTSFSRSVRWLRLGKANHVPEIERFRRRSTPPHEWEQAGTRTNLLFTMSYRTGIGPKPSANLALRMTTHPLDTKWWSRTGSNRRPPACKAGALPAELRPRLVRSMVGLDRLELSTSPSSGVRSNHLSYRPSATLRGKAPYLPGQPEGMVSHSRRKRNEGGRRR